MGLLNTIQSGSPRLSWGLAIGRDQLRMVAVRPRRARRPLLQAWSQRAIFSAGLPLQPGDAWPWEAWAEGLEALLLDLSAHQRDLLLPGQRRPVAVGLPDELLFQGQCWLPFGLPPTEVRARVGQQIRQETGFSLTDLAWDCAYLPLLPGPGEPDAAAHCWVAAPKGQTDGLLRLLASVGLDAVALEQQGQSLARFCRAGLHRVVRRDSALVWAYALVGDEGVQVGAVQGRRAIGQAPWWPWTAAPDAAGPPDAPPVLAFGLRNGSDRLAALQSALLSARAALMGDHAPWSGLVLVGDAAQAPWLVPQLPALAEAMACPCGWLVAQSGCSGATSATSAQLAPAPSAGVAGAFGQRAVFDSAYAGALSLALWPAAQGLW